MILSLQKAEPMSLPADIKRPLERIEEAVREIGVLLIALAPLDMAFSGNDVGLSRLLIFLGLGATLFVMSLALERRRGREAR